MNYINASNVTSKIDEINDMVRRQERVVAGREQLKEKIAEMLTNGEAIPANITEELQTLNIDIGFYKTESNRLGKELVKFIEGYIN